ncbi:MULTISPECIES: hypothetical protein [unclassified Bradyrhizobium]|uniref:hypothetical protein n=1 Tax=unclassified Bradyrhizobium TaxID=2631580 RepID=UPI0028E6EC9D|nr:MULTISPECIES: hypothetical protein [unclassified Bradyrhizobium]
MSGTSAGWTPERRARQAALMTQQNQDASFQAKRNRAAWSEERKAQKRAQMLAQNADPVFRARNLDGISRRRPRGDIEIPAHTHPIVRGFFAEMREQQASMQRVACQAGISADTISGWRKHMPVLDVIEAALGSLDLELAIVPRGQRDANGFLQRRLKGQDR